MRHDAPTTAAHPLVLRGLSEEVLRGFDDNTFDAAVTDPPYELNFTRMAGRGWDNTGVAFNVEFWAEVLRVIKPGGNLFAFGSPRTYHRLAVAIEDAGFELRDSILAWVKASSFPKSQKIPELLDKAGEPALAAEWEGMGTGLKPAHEPIVVARKPLADNIVANIIQHCVGGINIDHARIATGDDRSRTPGASHVGDIMNLQRGGTAKNESHPGGRWPTNMLLIHSPECVEGGVCADGCPAAELERQSPGSSRFFPSFHFAGRAAASERPNVNSVEHISVKPLSVMEWLVGLAAMPGQLILDPFAGSGATVEAAMRLGVRCVAIEEAPDYIPLIKERVKRQGRRVEAAA